MQVLTSSVLNIPLERGLETALLQHLLHELQSLCLLVVGQGAECRNQKSKSVICGLQVSDCYVQALGQASRNPNIGHVLAAYELVDSGAS